MSDFEIYVGNPYLIFNEEDVICVTTNAEIKVNNRAVMGRGCAEFVRNNFKDTDKKLALYLRQYGNRVFNLGIYSYNGKSFRLVTFPTKNMWRDNSSLELIAQSAKQLVELADKMGFSRVYIPIPGCTNGNLKWSQVKQRLDVLDKRFVVYSFNESDFSR